MNDCIWCTERKGKVSEGRVQTGSYRSWKPWKVLEFYFDIFQDFQIKKKRRKRLQVLEICFTIAIKFSEFTLQEMYVDGKQY